MPATGPPPLNAKQQHVLAALRDAAAGASLHDADAGSSVGPWLASSELASRFGVKLDVMRRTLERLRERGLISGLGRGAARQWELTHDGEVAIGDRDPAPIPDPASRVYVVMWERSMAELLGTQMGVVAPDQRVQLEESRVFVRLGELKARNSEDAYRRAIREYADVLPSSPVLSAVAVRYWQPVPVSVSTQTHISIG